VRPGLAHTCSPPSSTNGRRLFSFFWQPGAVARPGAERLWRVAAASRAAASLRQTAARSRPSSSSSRLLVCSLRNQSAAQQHSSEPRVQLHDGVKSGCCLCCKAAAEEVGIQYVGSAGEFSSAGVCIQGAKCRARRALFQPSASPPLPPPQANNSNNTTNSQAGPTQSKPTLRQDRQDILPAHACKTLPAIEQYFAMAVPPPPVSLSQRRPDKRTLRVARPPPPAPPPLTPTLSCHTSLPGRPNPKTNAFDHFAWSDAWTRTAAAGSCMSNAPHTAGMIHANPWLGYPICHVLASTDDDDAHNDAWHLPTHRAGGRRQNGQGRLLPR
jgi:hypothetical protein